MKRTGFFLCDCFEQALQLYILIFFFTFAQTTSNLQRIAVATGNGSIPVYKGAAAPLVQFRRDASHYHGPVSWG